MGKFSAYDLGEGSVWGHLLRMTGPMVWAFLAMSAFNMTDTFFVSKLGSGPLAAMSFTFPVVTVIICIARGLGMGASSAIARAIGAGDDHEVRRLATDALILTVMVVGVCAVAGVLTIDWLFALMGAPESLLPMIREYMLIWYLGVALVFIPMTGNHIMRALGNTMIPALVMSAAVVLNLLLDPLLIFGLWGFPRMGMAGAAVATVLSRLVTLVFTLAVLHYKYRLLVFSWPGLAALSDSWRRILHIALPSAANNVLQPLAGGVLTWIAAGFGTAAVAAAGTSAKIQMFCNAIPVAMGLVMVPLIGQNWGKKRYGRVVSTLGAANVFSLIYALLCLGVFAFAARPLARQFSEDPEVVNLICMDLYISLFFSGLLHVSVNAVITLNSIGRPMEAWMAGFVRFIVLTIPLAWLGGRLLGMPGVFWGSGIANGISGLLCLLWMRRVLVQEDGEPVRSSGV